MKRLVSLCIILLFFLTAGLSGQARAEEIREDTNPRAGAVFAYSLNSDGRSYTITGLKSGFLSGTVQIPVNYLGKPVTAIANSAFQDAADSGANWTVVFPAASTISSIGQFAFYNAGLMGRLSLPSKLNTIGMAAFELNPKLNDKLIIPGSVSSLGGWAFLGCTGLEALEIQGNRIKKIPESTFEGCGFQQVSLPPSLEGIGDNAFQHCYKMAKLYLPNDLKTIGTRAFYDCQALGSITLPNSVYSVGVEAFSECELMTSAKLSNSMTSIPKRMFWCTSLSDIKIPKGISSIGAEAFRGTPDLRVVIFDGNAPTMGTDAFAYSNDDIHFYYR